MDDDVEDVARGERMFAIVADHKSHLGNDEYHYRQQKGF
jgi:hypothetical protein